LEFFTHPDCVLRSGAQFLAGKKLDAIYHQNRFDENTSVTRNMEHLCCCSGYCCRRRNNI